MDFAVERTLAHVIGVEPTSPYSQRNRVFYHVLKLHMYGLDYIYTPPTLVSSFWLSAHSLDFDFMHSHGFATIIC